MDRAVLETSSDRYVIVEYLAEGGMGAIYLGKKIGVGGFEKEVVLKQLLPELTREPKFIDLFLREARLSASLDHANIVRTVDLVTAGDDYFMVMEYVRGGDLRTLLKRARRRHQKFAPPAALFIGHELLEALGYAHTRVGPDGRPLGLIHRDVSPSNILVSGAGEVKLTDFGIAKASTHRSVFFKVKGKIGYMAPEQARGEPIDVRTDVFSLAVVVYEVLVGERLFVGDLMTTAKTIYAQPIAPPSRRRPEIPPEIDGLILKALSLDPRGRFQSAAEFSDALTRVATKQRLLWGASEFASHLKQVCGEDPSQWLRIETLPSEETQGTSMVTGASDDHDDEEERSQSGPRPLPQKKELTSVIALAEADDSRELSDSVTTTVRDPANTTDEHTLVREGGPKVSAEEETGPRTLPPIDVVLLSGHQPESFTGPVKIDLTPGRQPESFTGPHAVDLGTPPPRKPAKPPPRKPAKPPPPRKSTKPTVERSDSFRAALRLWPLAVLLLLIGVAVALAVAFSGPELEVPEELMYPQLPPAQQPR